MARLKDIRGLKYPDAYLMRFFFKNALHNSPGKVLEVGCANGCNLMLFKEFGWETVGIDNHRQSLDDAEANFAAVEGDEPAYQFLEHDLSTGLPAELPARFECLLFPSALYYISRQSMIRVLGGARRVAQPGAAYYLRMRALDDYRYGRGDAVERNGFRLSTSVTGELGAVNVFYHEYELVDLLRDHLGADTTSMKILHVKYENVQNDVIVPNSDIVLWGRLAT